MSAIAGIICSKNVTLSDLRSVAKQMGHIQAHGGPDQQNIYAAEDADSGICFIDNGSPVHDETKSIRIVFDGFIYNYAALRKQLAGDHHLRTDEHSEVVIHLYEEYGTECLEHIHGIFAFAIRDSRSRTLFLARDRLGEKTLYWYKDRDKLLFATEIKALLKTGLIDKELDLEAIYHYLFLKAFLHPETPFRNVRSLLPGHYAVYRWPDEFSISQYWDISTTIDYGMKEDYAIERSHDLLVRSIESSCPANGPLGVSLSGGLDSSLIVSIMRKELGREVETATVDFDSGSLKQNDFHYADVVAEHFGVPNHKFVMTGKDVLDYIVDILWHVDSPICGTFQNYFAAKAASETGVSLLYTGVAADTVFGMANRTRKFLVFEKFLTVFRLIPAEYRTSMYDWLYDVFSRNEARYSAIPVVGEAPKFLHKYFEFKKGLISWKGDKLTDGEAMGLLRSWDLENVKSVGEVHRGYYLKCDSKSAFARQLYTKLKTQMPTHVLVPYNSVSAAYSIESRFPYMSHELVEFTSTIPPSLKVKDKPILRSVAKRLLPPEICNRPKAGFDMPFAYWLKNDLRDLVEHVLSRRSIQNRGFLDYESVKSVKEQFYSSQGSMPWVDLWALVSLELWLRLYYDPIDIQRPTFTANEVRDG